VEFRNYLQDGAVGTMLLFLAPCTERANAVEVLFLGFPGERAERL